MQGQQRILPLTSLRFFAALFVVFFHTTPLALRARLPGVIAQTLGLGFTSVSFFFTLSGYILAIVYLSRGGLSREGGSFTHGLHESIRYLC